MPDEKRMRSDIAWSSADRIVVRGLDFSSDVLGKMDLASFSFLQIMGFPPTSEQSRVYEAIVMTLVEHGITPSVLAARLTHAGAPESVQAAVAAGLLGLGSVFIGSAEGAARMLHDVGPDDGADLAERADRIVEGFLASGNAVPGIGHPIHKPIDPRTPRLWEIAAENGLSGGYVEMMKQVSFAAERRTGRRLPVNATGAVGALSCELGLPWETVRGIGVMARAIGLVGHLLEESRNPMAHEIWRRADVEASRHLREPSEERRAK
jgi:citrate synthase